MENEAMDDLNNMQDINHDQNRRSESIANASKKLKMFKITKVGDNKKDDSQNSFYNVSSEERKNIIMNYNNMKERNKLSQEASHGDSNVSTKGTNSYICLDEGKVIIKGNHLETIVPCDIETLNGKVTMISPH